MKPFVKVTSIIVSIAVIAGSVYAVTNTRDILDWFALRNYTPSQQLVTLADQTTMNDQTRRVFYVNHPEVLDKPEFKVSCTQAEQTIVLGCYITNDGIFLLKVDDPRLEGILQVTAAHEVLHALYDRLSAKERADVDRMTSEFFATLDNERIKTTVENYRAKDPAIVPNELHSILASEVRTLSPELEAYYARYFTNRGAVVDYSEKYEQTFIGIETQVKDYDVRLEQLKTEIDQSQASLEGTEIEIDTQKQRLDALLNANEVEAYNASVPGFNALVNRHNALIKTTQAQVDEYNQIVEARNALATTEAELVEAIDANSIPKQQ